MKGEKEKGGLVQSMHACKHISRNLVGVFFLLSRSSKMAELKKHKDRSVTFPSQK